METPSQKNVSKETLKKVAPYFFLLILTVGLMLFFKSNKKGLSNLIEESKKNLLSLYTGGLRPLISETQISQEDLFNFALYKSLPIDQEKNKVLLLSNKDGNQVYEIKPASFNKNTNNFESFKNFLELDQNQRLTADSVINSYRRDIYSCVLVNDKNAYAINPKISQLQKAMLADLVYFAQNNNYAKAKEMFPDVINIDNAQLVTLVKTNKKLPSSEYLLMTPDTIARTEFFWDEKKFEEQIKAFEAGRIAAEEIAKNQAFTWDGVVEPPAPPVPPTEKSDYNYKIDSNKYKITFNEKDFSKIVDQSVKVGLENIVKHIHTISVNTDKKKTKQQKGGLSIVPPITDEVLKVVKPSLEAASSALKMVGSLNLSKIMEEALKNDTSFQKEMKDSVKRKEFYEKMKDANKQMKKMKLDTIKYQ